MNKHNEFHLIVVAECVLNQKVVVKATCIEEAKFKTSEYLDNIENSFSMDVIHKAVKDRKIEKMKIGLIDFDDDDFNEAPDDDRLIFTHIN